MPLREIEDKFTTSEIVITSWRSQEMSASFDKKNKRLTKTEAPSETRKAYEGLPPKFFNEEGDLDLRKVSSAEGYKFLRALGFVIPIMSRRADAK